MSGHWTSYPETSTEGYDPPSFSATSVVGPRPSRKFRLAFCLLLPLALILSGCSGADDSANDAANAADASPGQDTDETADNGTADELANYFDGKTITILVGFSPGGGYDTSARIIAEHLPKHLPGEPRNIVVQNVEGDGGLRSMRRLWESSPDGLTIAAVNPRFVLNDLTGEFDQFDTEQQYLGALRRRNTPVAMWVKRDVAESWAELVESGQSLTEAGTAPGSLLTAGPALAEHLGYPVEVVYGYAGGAERRQAFERGEVNSYSGSRDSVIEEFPDWPEEQEVLPILRWGPAPLLSPPDSALAWLEELGVTEEPPHILEALDVPENVETAFTAATELQEIARSGYAVAPDTPDNIFDMWVEVIRSLPEDEEYIEAMHAAGYTEQDFGYSSREELLELYSSVQELDDETYELFEELAVEQ